MRKNIDSAMLIAICTAILYSWSTANYQGFLSTAKLDPDIMERSFHQVIYSGLLISFAPIIITIIIATVFIFIYAHALLPMYIDYLKTGIKAKRNIINLKYFWVGKRKTPQIEIRARKFFNRVACLSLVAIVFIGTMFFAEAKGSKKAKDLLKDHFDVNKHKYSSIEVEIDGEKKELRGLACGVKNCAGIHASSNIIYYFPILSGFSYVYKKENNYEVVLKALEEPGKE